MPRDHLERRLVSNWAQEELENEPDFLKETHVF